MYMLLRYVLMKYCAATYQITTIKCNDYNYWVYFRCYVNVQHTFVIAFFTRVLYILLMVIQVSSILRIQLYSTGCKYDYVLHIIPDTSIQFNLFVIKGHRPLTHHITVYTVCDALLMNIQFCGFIASNTCHPFCLLDAATMLARSWLS